MLISAHTTPCSQGVELRNKVDIKVTGLIIASQNEGYLYEYAITNFKQSEQKVWVFRVIVDNEKLIENIQAPKGWFKPKVKPLGRGLFSSRQRIAWVAWGSPDALMIRPEDFMSGFKFYAPSFSLPGIVDYYGEGYAPSPWFPEGSAPDYVSGYDDFTPYGPGVVGKTIGPVEPPVDFNPIRFMDNIISMKHEAFSLGWIKNRDIENSLDVKLENAKKKIEQGNTNVAKNVLDAFSNEVEAQKGKHLTSEAYGLLKYNVRYLIEKL
jgi:hypothetical protein